MLKETIQSHFDELLATGARLIAQIPPDQYGGLHYWVDSRKVPEYQRWLSSAVNLLGIIARPDTFFVTESRELMTQAEKGEGVTASTAQKMLGLLQSACDEWQKGMLRQVEYVVAAATFDDFLDHAAVYHKANKKIEGAVLASAVLEDTIKKICTKQGITTAGQSMEQLIDALVKADVLTQVKAKRLKSNAGVRNHAVHAEWDDFDIKDVGDLISGIRDAIDSYL